MKYVRRGARHTANIGAQVMSGKTNGKSCCNSAKNQQLW